MRELLGDPDMELFDCPIFATQAEARRDVSGFIEGLCHARRLHSALGITSPADFGTLHRAA